MARGEGGGGGRAGHFTWTQGTSGGGDTTAPSAPSGLAATVSGTSVSLAWKASTDDVEVTGYQVWRGGGQVGTASGTSFTDSGLSASTSYSYTVKAVDAAGNVSAASNTVTVTTSSSGGGGTGPIDTAMWYTVKNTNSGKCVDDADGSTGNGGPAQSFTLTAQ
ncbi:fibronectin type III domain-containing protein [Streptomyces sp. NBC_00138]|uniref:fibronectin type III domain-containing protein n=1 Tax=Streptomyces sp. NBC_00138 TaxID=2903625 RepID=UPI00386EE205